jgi:hypothetical protein
MSRLFFSRGNEAGRNGADPLPGPLRIVFYGELR